MFCQYLPLFCLTTEISSLVPRRSTWQSFNRFLFAETLKKKLNFFWHFCCKSAANHDDTHVRQRPQKVPREQRQSVKENNEFNVDCMFCKNFDILAFERFVRILAFPQSSDDHSITYSESPPPLVGISSRWFWMKNLFQLIQTQYDPMPHLHDNTTALLQEQLCYMG